MSTPDQDHAIPARLRAARLQQGLDIAALARELKNPRAVLEAIERGDWSRLGAPVFARHLVRAYAARLGVEVDVSAIADTMAAPVLQSQLPASKLGRFADFSARHAAYAGGTLLVVPLVYTLLNMTATGPSQVRALDPAPAVVAAAAPPQPTLAAPAPRAPAEVGPPETLAASPSPMAAAPIGASGLPAAPPATVAASLAGTVAEPAEGLVLRFSGDSWIEVFGRDGAAIERVLARGGDVRRFAIADVGRVTIGNVGATEVTLDGSRVNLDEVRAANVARFALSSDGSIEAVAR